MGADYPINPVMRAVGTLIAERYRIEAPLGVGGMGAVYRVRDERGRCSLALKELRIPEHIHDSQDGREALLKTQFEREYHTLVQLRHPSIIEVYDYGLDERANPFYTMELLDGEDLRERAPPTWREACVLLRDVASSLAIMHSRRLLHRDISARNIRCTTNARAKLIDFGAMAPMGLLRHVVGTPPFVPPEALQLQALDGRADLFAVGAVFFWLLTRRHAYPAHQFAELPGLWRTPLASPRQYDVELPPALDQLIMQLLALDRNDRPASAAELIERLCGIAELSPDERPAVSAAYLATPVLVGRERLLQQVRTQLIAARQGSGGAVLIEGAPGSGRSRALDACVLEAKLLGSVVLRGEPADAGSGDYGVARSLAEQLFAAVPKLARRCAAARKDLLCHLLPQLREPLIASLRPPGASLPASAFTASARPPGASPPPNAFAASAPPPSTVIRMSIPGVIAFETHPPARSERPRASQSPGSRGPERQALQAALRDFIGAVAREKPLVVAIDDADAIDEPSAALLAALAHGAKRRKLTLLVSVSEAHPGQHVSQALGLLRQMSDRLALAPLELEQTEALLRSIFGDIPNVAAVSQCVHRSAGGNPRSTMELAQHLVSRGLARYDAGSWALPPALELGDVPFSLSESLALRLAELSADAFDLAEALALTNPTLMPVSDYSSLTDHADHARTYHALSALTSAGVLLAAGDGYRFRDGEVAAALRDRLSPERARALHGRLARVLAQRGETLQLAEHQLLGGYEREGIESVQALCEGQLGAQATLSVLALIERALDWAERNAEPMRVRSILCCRLLFQAASLGDYPRFAQRLPEVRKALERQSGLADYYEIDHIADSEARAREALRRASERFDATPVRDQTFRPQEACVWLGQLWSACVDMAAIGQDLTLLEDLSPTAPFVPFAPMLRGIDPFVDCQRAMQAGRFPIVGQCAAAMLKELSGPAYADVTPAERARLRLPYVYILALFAAVQGQPRALEYVKEFDQAHFRSHALRIRMVYELMHGRTEAAAMCQRRAELLALQDSGAIALPGSTTRIELLASVYADDLLGVKRCMERIEALAAVYPRWKSTLAIARAHYRRLQGDFGAALAAADEAVALAPVGRHYDWALAASTQLALMNELDRGEEALLLGEQHIAAGAREGLSASRAPLLRVMAECCLRVGRLEQALSMAEEHVAGHLQIGTQGLQLGLAYETRARVAVAMRDEAAFHHYAPLCAAEYKASRNALLSRKYQELIREADAVGVTLVTTERHAVDFSSALGMSDAAHTLHSRLLTAVGSGELPQRTLRLLLETVGAAHGYLFGTRSGQPELLATCGEIEGPSDALVLSLERFIAMRSNAARAALDAANDEATMMQAEGCEPATVAIAFEPAEAVSSLAVARAAPANAFEPVPLFATRRGEHVLVALAAIQFVGVRRVVPTAVLAAFADALLTELG